MTQVRQLAELVEAALASHADPTHPADTAPPPRGPLIAAVSAGPDSTALALACADLADRGRLPGRAPWILAHVDHRVRPNSDRDAAHARALADRLGAQFELRSLTAPVPLPPTDAAADRASNTRRPSAATLRDARYTALLDIAMAHGSNRIATAHHADDVLETALFRAHRGTSVRGLAGIPPLRRLSPPQATPPAWLLRPFLPVHATALRRACRSAGAPFVDDPTNRDTRHPRARIRHAILPALRRCFGPDLDAALLALVDLAAARTGDHHATGARYLAAQTRYDATGAAHLEHPAPEPGLEDALYLLHVQFCGTPPTQSWLRRAHALRTAAPGKRVDGRGNPLRVERTASGLRVGPWSAVSDRDSVRSPV